MSKCNKVKFLSPVSFKVKGACRKEEFGRTPPPKHGNFGKELPVVYRWAYDYSVPGADKDFIPQNVPPGPTTAGLEPTQS